MKFSASTMGFYAPEIHGANIPADAVDVAAKDYSALMSGQQAGKIISADAHGKPVLSDRPAATPEQIAAAVTGARSAAYIKEADPLFFKAQRGEATMDEWLAKVAEIKARFPDGVKPF